MIEFGDLWAWLRFSHYVTMGAVAALIGWASWKLFFKNKGK